MKREVELGGQSHAIEISHKPEGLSFTIDGAAIRADAVEVAPGLYSILIAGQSFEVRLEPFGDDLRIAVGQKEFVVRAFDPRRRRTKHSRSASLEGRQTVAAPMPGRVVRLLVVAGQQVSQGQGLAVIEAMKMQNEVRSPKQGKVERLLVAPGQALNAEDSIAIIS